MSLSNYIFASGSKEDNKARNNFESNQDAIDITKILNENKGKVKRQTVYIEERDIAYTTVRRKNDTLTEDEIKVVQQGKKGKEQITIKKVFEGDELISEDTIVNQTIDEPVEEIIEIGTLELPKSQIKNENINQSQIIVGSYEDRKSNALSRLCLGMDLRQKSGLTLDDFKKMASNEPKDKYNVFADNAEVFYYMEQKYNINGIFLMALAIHESGWGTSDISKDKKNLFGYGAYDSDPYNSSFSFSSYAEGIELITRVLVKYYMNQPGTPIFDGQVASGSFYYGPNLPAINLKYASDPQWSTKVYNIMEYLYGKL